MILCSCITVSIIGIAFVFSLYKEYNVAAFALFVLLYFYINFHIMW